MEHAIFQHYGLPPNSSPAIAGSPFGFGSANRWICGSLTLAQISPHGETSHIPGTLAFIVKSIETINKNISVLYFKSIVPRF